MSTQRSASIDRIQPLNDKLYTVYKNVALVHNAFYMLMCRQETTDSLMYRIQIS